MKMVDELQPFRSGCRQLTIDGAGALDGGSEEALGRATAASELIHSPQPQGETRQTSVSGVSSHKAGGRDSHGRRGPNQGSGRSVDPAAENRRLAAYAATEATDPSRSGMREARRKLPAFSQRQELLELLAARSVVVVSGATGDPER